MLDLLMDAQFVQSLKYKDKQKDAKNGKQKSRKGKMARAKERLNKLKNAQTEFLSETNFVSATCKIFPRLAPPAWIENINSSKNQAL